jgi:hypothetical protein
MMRAAFADPMVPVPLPSSESSASAPRRRLTSTSVTVGSEMLVDVVGVADIVADEQASDAARAAGAR